MSKRLTLEEFKANFKERQPELYNKLDVIKYITSGEIIVEDEHGLLNVTASRLYKGRIPTIESAIDKNKYYISKARIIHGDTYKYTSIGYTVNGNKIRITCRKHGNFQQTASNHLIGQGCPKCCDENTGDRCRLSQKEFVDRCNKVHNHKYNYLKVKYHNFNTKVEIVCPHHGDFLQISLVHVLGHGCPVCADILRGFSWSKGEGKIEASHEVPCSIYILKLINEGEIFWKVGVSDSVSKRLISIKSKSAYKVELLSHFESNVFDSVTLEQQLLKKYKHLQYWPKQHFAGYTECFSVNPLEHFEEFTRNNETK